MREASSWLAAFLIREKVLHEPVLVEIQALIRWGAVMMARSEGGGKGHQDRQDLQGNLAG